MRETAALEVGEKAPDFTLLSTTGDKISLSQFQGKQFVLIEFYGADFGSHVIGEPVGQEG